MASPKLCVCGCDVPLVGKQMKYSSPECSKKSSRTSWIFRTYGLTDDDWNKIWDEQGQVCAICKRPPRKKKDGTLETFHLDHEHQDGPAGPVRGIVCPYDNTRIIGRLKSHERAQALADYLREPPATRALGREVWAPGRARRKKQPRKRPRSSR